MNNKAPLVIEVRDLTGELETLDLLGIQGMCDPTALARFQACAVELRDWTPTDQQSMGDLMQGLSHMLIGAFSLHNHADMQRLLGSDQSAASVPFDIAQACLRKAVVVLEIAMRNAARDAAGPLSPEESRTGESIH